MLQPRLSFQRLNACARCMIRHQTRSYASVVEDVQINQLATQFERMPSTKDKLRMHGVDLVRYKPRTPGTRHLVRPRNEHLWKGRPFHPLTVPKKGLGQAGRNNTGHITVRHRGGGHKRRIRIIDFYRNEPGTHIVERIEYDPNRSAHIALLTSQVTGRKSYIIAADGMRAGDLVESYRKGIPKTLIDAMGGQIDHGVLAAKTALRGNCLPLSMIPQGVPIYNIAYTPDGPAQVCRSAGTYAVIVAKGEDQVDKDLKKLKANAESGDYLSKMPIAELAKLQKTAKYVSVRLSSGEVRLFDKQACATIGVASNRNFNRQQLGKAGRSRWLGIRPTVRGLAMNANEHPHGGGRGKSKGNVHPKSPWGMPAKSGYKTRPKDKPNKMVVKERPRNQGQRRRGRQ